MASGERTVWYALIELRNPQPEPFAVMSVDVTAKRDGGIEGTIVSLHHMREEAERIVHEFNEGTIVMTAVTPGSAEVLALAKRLSERLRAKRVQGRNGFYNPDELCVEAADLIDRLAAKPADPDAMNEKRAAEDAKLASNVREECAKCVPTNWCDPLLTGPDAPKGPLGNREVERLLRGIQDRIRTLSTTGAPKP